MYWHTYVVLLPSLPSSDCRVSFPHRSSWQLARPSSWWLSLGASRSRRRHSSRRGEFTRNKSRGTSGSPVLATARRWCRVHRLDRFHCLQPRYNPTRLHYDDTAFGRLVCGGSSSPPSPIVISMEGGTNQLWKSSMEMLREVEVAR
jgi:hypothetical protein